MPGEEESDFSTDVLLDVLFNPKWSALNTSCSYMNDTNGLNRFFYYVCICVCMHVTIIIWEGVGEVTGGMEGGERRMEML